MNELDKRINEILEQLSWDSYRDGNGTLTAVKATLTNQAHAAIKRLVLEGRIAELYWFKLRIGEDEQTLSSDGVHTRPAAAGRNKLKQSLRLAVDNKTNRLTAELGEVGKPTNTKGKE